MTGKVAWTKGFEELFKGNELKRMLKDYEISQKEYQEAKNDKEVAMKMQDYLDEIANSLLS